MKTTFDRMKSQFAIPVIRYTDGKILKQISQALAKGGLQVLEITLMSPAAFDVIAELSQDPTLIIGAGTVLNEKDAQNAIAAGAKFLVSPGLDAASVKYAHSQGIPFVPGVLTPSEVMRAQAMDCPLVKVFPIASMGGPEYIKHLQGPFPSMQWMCTGGVGIEDIPAFRAVGVNCLCIGRQLMPTSAIESGNWEELTRLAQNCLKQ